MHLYYDFIFNNLCRHGIGVDNCAMQW